MTPSNDPNKKFQYVLNLGLAGFAGQVGCVTLVIVFGALFGGLWLDRTLNVRPLFTILLLLGSVPVTIFVMFRLALGAIAKIKPVLPPSQKPEEMKKEEDLVSSETTTKRLPVKRWIVLVLVVIGVYCAFLGPTFLRPVSPAVVLPGEPTGLAIGTFQITNTLLATLIGDVALLVCAFIASSFIRSGKMVPEGFYGFFEFLIEFLWNAAEGAAGNKWARRIFPWTATIFLLVFSVNMTKLIPGFESIGRLEAAHGSAKGYAPVKLFNIGSMGIYTIDGTKPQPQEKHDEKKTEAKPAEVKPADAAHAETKPAEAEHAAEGVCAKSCEVIPFLRGAPTDLNFTFALAVVTVVLIQVFGLWALGIGYLGKFFNFRTMFTVPMFGVIDFAVGLLELVSEFAKILSFGFRLFGNIFAGALLISILGALTAVVVPSALYGLEVFVGAIQAYVFSMLALVFISQATVSHHGGDEHSEEHH